MVLSDDAAHDATFTLSCPPERADRVRDAVAREVGEIADDRSGATVERVATEDGDGAAVRVTVAARDVAALRAATGTWLGLVEAAERTAVVAEVDGR